jgi:4-phytase / acid phosphatase
MLAFAASADIAPASAATDKLVFAVVVSRHGVRSLTKPPAQYTWPDWSPVQPGYLTAHGYRLMTYMGKFYSDYLASIGLPLSCRPANAYVYADHEQRPYESARAIVEGACGSAQAIPIFHDAQAGQADPMFDGSDWLVTAGKVDSAASERAVAAAAPNPPSAIVAEHASDFNALAALLAGRCSGSCTPVTAGASTISVDKGLAELRGPVDAASSYAEALFLEYAQCRPLTAINGGDATLFLDRLQAAMRLHVLAYDVNSRNGYNSQVRGGNLFAHIVGLLEQKAGVADAQVDVPAAGADNAAFIVGHDTQLGALGGILDAHWNPQGGVVADDMPPGSALIFELYRTPQGEYRVKLRFAYQSITQLRGESELPSGTAEVPVRFEGCTSGECSVPLADLAKIAGGLVERGFVQKAWTPATAAPLDFPTLADPDWTACDR